MGQDWSDMTPMTHFSLHLGCSILYQRKPIKSVLQEFNSNKDKHFSGQIYFFAQEWPQMAKQLELVKGMPGHRSHSLTQQ